MKYSYKTKGTCSSVIDFDIEGDVVKNVQFTGGCNGNLKAISSLVEGMKVTEIEEKLKGFERRILNLEIGGIKYEGFKINNYKDGYAFNSSPKSDS